MKKVGKNWLKEKNWRHDRQKLAEWLAQPKTGHKIGDMVRKTFAARTAQPAVVPAENKRKKIQEEKNISEAFE